MTCLTSCERSFRARVGGSRIQPGFPATGPQRTLSPKRLSPSTRSAQSAAPLETLDPPAPLNPLFVSVAASTWYQRTGATFWREAHCSLTLADSQAARAPACKTPEGPLLQPRSCTRVKT